MYAFLNLIAWLLILGVVWWLVTKYVPLPAPVPVVLNGVFLLLLVLILLGFFGVIGFGLPALRFGG